MTVSIFPDGKCFYNGRQFHRQKRNSASLDPATTSELDLIDQMFDELVRPHRSGSGPIPPEKAQRLQQLREPRLDPFVKAAYRKLAVGTEPYVDPIQDEDGKFPTRIRLGCCAVDKESLEFAALHFVVLHGVGSMISYDQLPFEPTFEVLQGGVSSFVYALAQPITDRTEARETLKAANAAGNKPIDDPFDEGVVVQLGPDGCWIPEAESRLALVQWSPNASIQNHLVPALLLAAAGD